jgi:Tfp pilus assembly protein PilX
MIGNKKFSVFSTMQKITLKTKNYPLKTKRGFTLMLAVLVGSLLLAIGLAIFNITLKELVLSSSARDSLYAFYAADTGIECALYWDLTANAFATSTTNSSATCNGTSLGTLGGGGYGVVNTFTFTLSPDRYCTTVSVTKTASPQLTTINARGYNTCDTANPRRVERGIRVTY